MTVGTELNQLFKMATRLVSTSTNVLSNIVKEVLASIDPVDLIAGRIITTKTILCSKNAYLQFRKKLILNCFSRCPPGFDPIEGGLRCSDKNECESTHGGMCTNGVCRNSDGG